MGERQYNPGYGRFVTPDENLVDQDAGDPLSWNLFAYARNNPLRYADPTGRACQQNSDGSIVDDGAGTACDFAPFMTARAKAEEVAPATMDRSHAEWALGVFAEAGKRASDGSAIVEGYRASREVRGYLKAPIAMLFGAFVPAPKDLLGFPTAKRVRAKNPVQGGGGMRRRWKDEKGNIYEWDSRHGAVEKYSPNGKRHLGEFDGTTGQQTKPADLTKKIEP